MKLKKSVILSLSTALTVLAANPTLADGVLKYGMAAQDLGTMDPHRATTTPDKPITGWLFNGLVRFAPGSDDIGALEPDLAESWESNEDGTEWTFKLREDVEFHHGYGKVTAEDVVYSLNRSADPDSSAFSADYAAIDTIEAVDPMTVRITLSSSVPAFLGLVANYHGGNIVSKKAAEELGADFGTKPVGTGPFMVDEYVPQERVSFVANPDYFRGAPKLDGIDYRYIPSDSSRDLALKAGELDVSYGRQDQEWIDATESRDGLVVDIMRPAELQQFHLNTSSAPLDNIEVRRAVATALNRPEFIQFVGDSLAQPAGSVVPNGNLGWDDSTPIYGEGDPEAAKQMLADAGYPDGITLKMVQTSLPTMLGVAQVAQAQLALADIDLQLDVVDHQTFHSQIRDDLSQVVYYSAARFPVADVFLSQFFHSDSTVATPTGATNFSHCDVADEEIVSARSETDTDTQNALWAEAQAKIIENICAVPLYEQLIAYGRSENVDWGYDLQAEMHLGPIVTENSDLK
ncbi:ABC transporter substrate-binding protein [Roseicyclus sp. F158]|uniref:ABC transporter substrate-binding protein n=1 Tax=Tropicimonas omnivorans TaxID=3075590 RepID=A0ABU3DEM0_9RHOB|nr:ABC transporter substrate-binding protein [Roseicyclus sp. F158]MDT0682003.1 ABC transporter substrate-binding protein [Roseicyclus sp. F158]